MNKLSRHEKPLSKNDEHGNNPNKITISQHVIPSKHLLEWSVDDKMIELFDVKSQRLMTLPAKSAYFCVMRLWDQWTEAIMLKSNEDNYQVQLEAIKGNSGHVNTNHIMAYYALLCVRVWVANKERPHYPSIFSSISSERSKSELEKNELEMDGGIHFVDGTLDNSSQHLARQVVKIAMNQAFLQWCGHIDKFNWYILDFHDELVLSDSFYLNFKEGIHILPLTPNKAFIADSTYKHLSEDGKVSADNINKIMIRNAVNYYIQPPK